jgi:iron complex outermembrane receptor protein
LTASVDIQQTVRITNSMSLFVGGNVRYLGDRPSDFSTSADAPRLDLPAYTLLDLRAGAVINNWNISLFAQNVTNRFAVLGATPEIAGEDTGVNYAIVQRPRTIGISVVRSL